MADESNDVIEILEENIPIDFSKYISYIQAPHCGAISTFFGTTRDNFNGKTVVELHYEAYVPMAVKCIKSICSSARSSWNLNGIVVIHRLGSVAVGETSIFVAASSVHRGDSLDACKFLIDEFKATVPIWKKEVYSDGEVWKENAEFMDRRMELGDDGMNNGGYKKKGCCRKEDKIGC